jgi:hypothetical protein
MTQMESGGHGKDIMSNSDGAFADRYTSIECTQSYYYIKARETSSGLPPALSSEEDFHEVSHDRSSTSDEAQTDRAYMTEDEKFARVHSLRPQSMVTDSGIEDSDSLSDEENFNRKSPKQVRFAPRSAAQVSRPLTPQEAWALYHLEVHARECHSCNNGPLCDVGYGLSQDAGALIRKQGGECYSTQLDSEGNRNRVEIPYGYTLARKMLGISENSDKYQAPIISYEEESRSTRQREPRNIVSIEPTRRHRPDRDEVIGVTPSYRYETGEAVQLPRRSNKLGSYDGDMGHSQREHHVEDWEWRKRGREGRRERRREQESRDSDL